MPLDNFLVASVEKEATALLSGAPSFLYIDK